MALKYPALYKYEGEGGDIYIALVMAPDSAAWLNSGVGNWHVLKPDRDNMLNYIKEENFICMFPHEQIAEIVLDNLKEK